MALHKKLLVLSLISLSLSILFSFAAPDASKDIEECSEQLVGLATCLPYVSGNAQAPTPDCCSGLKQVLKTKKKCLCVVIKDRNDPGLALSINVTLALSLPSVCNAPANVSQCPALLNLPPNSTDAQIFYQFGHGSNGPASTPVPSAAKKDNPTSARSSGTSSPESSGCQRSKEWLGLEVIVGGVLLMWCYTFV